MVENRFYQEVQDALNVHIDITSPGQTSQNVGSLEVVQNHSILEKNIDQLISELDCESEVSKPLVTKNKAPTNDLASNANKNRRNYKIVPQKETLRLQSPEERKSRGIHSVMSTRSQKLSSNLPQESINPNYSGLRTRRRTQDPSEVGQRKIRLPRGQHSKSPGFAAYNQNIVGQFENKNLFQNQENLRFDDREFIKSQNKKLSTISDAYGIIRKKK